MAKDPSLRKRLVVIDIMIPTTVLFAMLGGWPLTIFVSAILGISAWEYWRIFHKNGFSISLPILLIFTVAAVILRKLFVFEYAEVS